MINLISSNQRTRRHRTMSTAMIGEALESRTLLSAAPIATVTSDRTPLIDNPTLATSGGAVVGNVALVTDPAFTPVPVSITSLPVERNLSPLISAPTGLSSLTLVSNLSNPHGVVSDESGNLWLSAAGSTTPSNALYEYSTAGTLLNSYTVDSTSNAAPGAVAIVPLNSATNGFTENTVLWEKSTGAVYAFTPSTATQKLLFTATSLTVDLSSVYDVSKSASSSFASIITPTTAVYANGLTIDETSTYDDFFLTGVSNNVPFILRVREQSGSIVSAKVIAASTVAPAGTAYAGGIAEQFGYIMSVLNYSSTSGTVPFVFADTFPESSTVQVTYTTTPVTSTAATTDLKGNYIFNTATAAAGSKAVYTEIDPFLSTLGDTSYTATVPVAASSFGIAFEIGTSNIAQTYIFNSVSIGYGEIWTESLATVFSGYSSTQLRNYYGLNQVTYDNGTAADGTGQTIAIIDFNDDPNLATELATFDGAMGIAAPPSLTQLNETGGTSLPSASTETAEESLDVEWSHAMAPGAKIVVFETTSSSNSDVQTAITTAKSYPGVSEISMSFGETESTSRFADSLFTTPSGHTGVTFIASSGDGGAYSGNPGVISGGAVVNSPASSINVLGVGGTTLAYNSSGAGVSETAWGYVDPSNSADYEGSGGGISKYETEQSWQTPVAGTLTGRGVPDVSLLADPNTGVKQFDVQAGGWFIDGGTSLSAPSWAGIIAVVNQGRVLHGQPVLNASTDLTIPAIYALSASDFNDITSGTNGAYSAKAGYDEVTGRGSPILTKLIPDLEAAYVTSSAVALPTASQYIRLDPNGIDVNIYNNTTGTGTPAEFYQLSTVTSLSLTGPTTGLAVTVDWSNGVPLPAAGFTFTGQGTASGNQLKIIGTPAGNDTVTSSASQISVNSVPVNFSDVGTLVFSEGTGTDVLTVNGGTLKLLAGSHTDYFSTISIASTATLAVTQAATYASRMLVDTATLTIAGATNAWTGTLDLSANDLAVTSGNLSTINNQIASGFAGGAWTGTGITSSTAAADSTHLSAVGSMLNNTNGTTAIYGAGTTLGTFDGVSPGANAVLAKYTFYGDANLDGHVDGSDYTLIDGGFHSGLTGWYNGDFNYDSTINGSDYTLVDNAFNTQSTTPAAKIAVATATIATAPPITAQATSTPSLFGDQSDKRRKIIEDVGL